MINKNIILTLVLVLIGLISSMFVSISGIFIASLLGLLLVPPVLVFVSVLKEGIPVIVKELKSLLVSGKEFFVISISKESITLEPQFR